LTDSTSEQPTGPYLGSVDRAGPVSRWLNTAQPEALFVLSAVAQYIGAVIAVGLFDEVEPRTVAWFRVIGATLALVVVSRPWRQRWTRAELVAAGLFGVATALMNLFFYLAIDRIDLGKAVTIEFLGPITVAAVATRSARNAVALLFAVAGVVVLGGGEVEGNAIGLLFIGLASAMWAAYIVIGSRVARLDRGVAGLGVGLAIGALAIAPVGAPSSGEVWTSPRLLALCLLVGVFSNAIGYGIDQFTMRRIPIRRFSLLLALLPVTAALIGWLVLDQRPSGVDMAGIALVLVGVVVQEREELAPIRAEVLTEPS
jgi:inner membrane transporter RhtA